MHCLRSAEACSFWSPEAIQQYTDHTVLRPQSAGQKVRVAMIEYQVL
jgi:hypothetical protein